MWICCSPGVERTFQFSVQTQVMCIIRDCTFLRITLVTFRLTWIFRFVEYTEITTKMRSSASTPRIIWRAVSTTHNGSLDGVQLIISRRRLCVPAPLRTCLSAQRDRLFCYRWCERCLMQQGDVLGGDLPKGMVSQRERRWMHQGCFDPESHSACQACRSQSRTQG